MSEQEPRDRRVRWLRLANVGPAPSMEVRFAPRFNIVTGDNGAGKSFLLDAIWWALTRTWPQQVNLGMGSGYMAEPRNRREPASITVGVEEPARKVEVEQSYRFDAHGERWVPDRISAVSAFASQLVLYGHADGSFSLFDPLRHGGNPEDGSNSKRPALVLTRDEVYNGASVERRGRTVQLCNGLITDWAIWTAARGREHESLVRVLNALGEDALDGPIELGDPTRLSLTDSREIPTILTHYAGAVPILHAAAGIRRVSALAYMLALALREHRIAAQRLGVRHCDGIVLLLDEVESHLHPRWQRLILGALRAAVDAAAVDIGRVVEVGAKLDAQVFVTTHSPLVMSAAEAFFDPDRDRWFSLDLVQEGEAQAVELRTPVFERLGRVGHWLQSADAFRLPTDRGNAQLSTA